MAHGTFHLATDIYRYDRKEAMIATIVAATIFIGSTMAVRGAVNCFPKLIQSETVAPSSQYCEV